ncbi:hypothetical protein LMG7974_01282 [Campylobacter majalis]|uniref:Phosphatidate cytidylyltransferase n=1 Tax=Campylobacter majalis TaxID=2790656 RepID=A0ABM8Q846_9BACT|nr:phosphatidate cytidylyltransferase [Campylobacter majalis]CAD7288984.1 hypothetical protein LMG7974_01282 [Campylobacter majalis]
MKERVTTGLMLLVGILFIFYINSYVLNFIIIGVVLYFAMNESLKIYKLNQHKNLVLISLVFYTLTYVTNPVFIAILAILVVASIQAYLKAESMRLVLPLIYPMMPIFLLWMLYSQYSIEYLAWLILAIVASDSGAYFVGKKYGKTPFSPSSPNKTIQGVLGGLFLGTVVGTMIGNYILEAPIHAAFTSFLICAFGVFGDLFESYLKRRANIKDSGSTLGSHGGVLDRIDGYLFAAPVLLWALSW